MQCYHVTSKSTTCQTVTCITKPHSKNIQSQRTVNSSQKNQCDELTVWRVDRIPAIRYGSLALTWPKSNSLEIFIPTLITLTTHTGPHSHKRETQTCKSTLQSLTFIHNQGQNANERGRNRRRNVHEIGRLAKLPQSWEITKIKTLTSAIVQHIYC